MKVKIKEVYLKKSDNSSLAQLEVETEEGKRYRLEGYLFDVTSEIEPTDL